MRGFIIASAVSSLLLVLGIAAPFLSADAVAFRWPLVLLSIIIATAVILSRASGSERRPQVRNAVWAAATTLFLFAPVRVATRLLLGKPMNGPHEAELFVFAVIAGGALLLTYSLLEKSRPRDGMQSS